MKKAIPLIFIFFVFILNGRTFANASVDCPIDGAIVEFRPSYFYPASSTLRHIFHQGGVNYQLTGTLPILRRDCTWGCGVNLWLGADYFSKKGHSSVSHEGTRICIVPLTLGAKCFFPPIGACVPVTFYAGGGMKYYWLKTHNSSEYVKQTIKKQGMGGVVEVGALAPIDGHWLVDFFVSYSFKSFGAPKSDNPAIVSTGVNIGGVNVGAGIGYGF